MRPIWQTFIYALGAMICLGVLSACGGGGGSDDDEPSIIPVSSDDPVPHFTVSALKGAAPLTVQVNASGSYDANGTIAAYSWDFGDGTTATTASTSHIYTVSANRTLQLTVTDDEGNSRSTSIGISVLPEPSPVTATFTADTTAGGTPLTVNFDASASSSTAGSIISYNWDFGDGITDTGAMPSHTFASSGSYLVTLTVTDSTANSSTSNLVVSTSNASGNDPLFSNQWHLDNTGQVGTDGNAAAVGEDVNLFTAGASVWDTYKGQGVVSAVVDDGLQLTHPDLSDNILVDRSHNYSGGSLDGEHGTAVGGVISARDSNSEGLTGVAPRSQLVGFNVLTNSTQANEADAMVRGLAYVDVSNNSWGPQDGLGRLDDSSAPWRAAVDQGVNEGRNGKGIVYLWAGGNGGGGSGTCGHCLDDSNYDGYANYRHVFAVAAANAQGDRSSYSETGANLLVTGYGGEFCATSLALGTTDLTGNDGLNDDSASNELADTDYTQCFNGTSGATPTVAGVVALILEANPNLTWRDVRRILASEARRIDPTDSDWITNGAGHWINHKYGFGVVDASAAVSAAETWTNLADQKLVAASSPVGASIPDNTGDIITNDIAISGSNITNIEFVEVIFDAPDHTYAGDLRIVLTSPDGTESVLARQHFCASSNCSDYDTWRFGSVRHMGEAANGTWTLSVEDQYDEDVGTFQTWTLNIYGY